MGMMEQKIQMVIQEVIIQVILAAPIIPALELIILEYPIHQLQKAHLKFQKKLSKIVKEIKERISYDLDLMNYVKKNTKIVIERSPKDNGPNGDYYKSTLKIQMGEIVFFEGKVQSTADGASTGPGKTIPLGNYTGELYNKSASYLNAIHLKSNDKNIVIDNDIFIHPDAKTALGDTTSYSPINRKPCSQGCPIEKYETFGNMTFTIKELGFKYGACTSINSGVMGDTIPVILTKGN